MKKILVTGPSGFVGKNIFSHLGEKYELVALGRDQGVDILNLDKSHGLFFEGVDCVVHLAGQTRAGDSLDKVYDYYHINANVTS